MWYFLLQITPDWAAPTNSLYLVHLVYCYYSTIRTLQNKSFWRESMAVCLHASSAEAVVTASFASHSLSSPQSDHRNQLLLSDFLCNLIEENIHCRQGCVGVGVCLEVAEPCRVCTWDNWIMTHSHNHKNKAHTHTQNITHTHTKHMTHTHTHTKHNTHTHKY